MKINDKAWDLLPDFGERLGAAMDAARMDPQEVRRGLAELGIVLSRNHIYNLKSGVRPNPSRILLAGLAEVLDVSPAWFFSTDDVTTTAEPTDAVRMRERFYSERSADLLP